MCIVTYTVGVLFHIDLVFNSNLKDCHYSYLSNYFAVYNQQISFRSHYYNCLMKGRNFPSLSLTDSLYSISEGRDKYKSVELMDILS